MLLKNLVIKSGILKAKALWIIWTIKKNLFRNCTSSDRSLSWIHECLGPFSERSKSSARSCLLSLHINNSYNQNLNRPFTCGLIMINYNFKMYAAELRHGIWFYNLCSPHSISMISTISLTVVMPSLFSYNCWWFRSKWYDTIHYLKTE